MKALAKSLVIFKPKWPWLVSVLGQLTKSTLPPLSKSPWQRKASRWSPPTQFTGYHPSKLFSLSKSEARACWPLTPFKMSWIGVTQTISEVLHPLLAVVWARLQVHSDWWWLPWEKFINKHHFNSNHCFFLNTQVWLWFHLVHINNPNCSLRKSLCNGSKFFSKT